MDVTFDLSEIEQTMPQQARKQLETELETTPFSLGDVLLSVYSCFGQSSPESGFYCDPKMSHA